MIDLHTHSLFSDGELVPAELTRRFEAAGYKAIAVTDHGDQSNVDFIIPRIVAFCEQINHNTGIKVIPGIELTHIPPDNIPPLVKRSRELGAKLVVVHGESIVEPVAPGTNKMAIAASADILAHPGLITEEEVASAKAHAVSLELTSRKGHSLTNGHVARLAQKVKASLVLNSDAHAPGDIWPIQRLHELVEGAGLPADAYQQIMKNANQIVERCLSSKK
jgi:putative hydrolase